MLRQLINLMPICIDTVLGPECDRYNQDKPVWNSYSKTIAYIKITADRTIRNNYIINQVGNLTNILMTYTTGWNWAKYNNSVVFNILSTMNINTADDNLVFVMQVLNSSRIDMNSEDFQGQFNIRNVYLVDTTSIVLELVWTGWSNLITFGFKSDSALKVSIIGTALDKSLFNIPAQFNNTCHKIQLNPIKGLPDGILTEKKKLLNKNNIYLLYYKNIKYKGGKYNMLRVSKYKYYLYKYIFDPIGNTNPLISSYQIHIISDRSGVRFIALRFTGRTDLSDSEIIKYNNEWSELFYDVENNERFIGILISKDPILPYSEYVYSTSIMVEGIGNTSNNPWSKHFIIYKGKIYFKIGENISNTNEFTKICVGNEIIRGILVQEMFIEKKKTL